MKRFTLCLAALCALCTPTVAQTIDLRISVHVIVDPTYGLRPPGITNELFYIAETNANKIMATYYRGYRYRITEITNVGGPSNGGAYGPSKWFLKSLSDDTNDWKQFQSEVVTNSLYRLRQDQVNVYVSQGYASDSGGASAIPPNNLKTAVEIYPDNGSFWMLHEIGHFFGLYHTFASENTTNCVPGDDGLSDTPLDSTCWQSQDDIALHYFGLYYNALNVSQSNYVNDIYFNVMSYHDKYNKNTTVVRLSEMQLDREADHASGDRNAFASGKSYFVSTSGTLLGTGGSTVPFRYLSQATNVASASGGDIILLRPGSYNEQLTINTPVTLRAPRTGWATIGK
jgi:hypothetical protein